MTTQENVSNNVTYNLLHQNMSHHHSILGEANYTNTHDRNKTLRHRLFERRTDEAVNLPIIKFRYNKYIIYFIFLCMYLICIISKIIYFIGMKFSLN